ncbi:GIY-YIG nuclease family protein [bacterium]|jgi:group I intron endonuclease|nr:GIY-YIG nuclease family protein [bacterium]
MVVYKTTNNINGKIYVGQDLHNNPKYLGSGKIFKQSLKKYGIENFTKEILEYCKTKEELNEKEIYWIEELKSRERHIGYNICSGGVYGNTISNNPNKEEICKKYHWQIKAKNGQLNKGKVLANHKKDV